MNDTVFITYERSFAAGRTRWEVFMKKFTRIAVLLLCAMTLSLVVYFGVYAEPSEDMDIAMPRATPVIDGEIEETGVWSEAFLFNENTADCFWTGNQLFARAKLYFAYDMKGLYFAADITDNKT